MVHVIITILIAASLGTLTGLGVGGGSLLIVWMTSVLSFDLRTARCVNLLFFFPSAIIAVIAAQKKHIFSLERCLPSAVSGCLTSFLFTFAAKSIRSSVLDKAFGILLITAAIFELAKSKRSVSG